MYAVARRGIQPCNGRAAELIKFVPNFLELHLSWTHNSLIGEGVEQFVEEYLPKIRANNPQVKYVLKRSHVLWDPFVVGQWVVCFSYQYLRTRKRRCAWKSALQVLAMVEEMAVGGCFYPYPKQQVATCLPRGLEIWNTETMGHDVFKVYSRWKADPPDPNEIPVEKHPNYIIRFNTSKKHMK
uniref:L51_S25_CI-B8 domain-containing protein n=1 Tax=Syphacia muris TaxID=451379 RepID=A0A0N5AA72_9BILA